LKGDFIKYQSSAIHYYTFGQGPATMFCFHGYGEDGSSFSLLENLAGKEYTFIAPDLPFHGLTSWNEGLDLTPETLITILEQLAPFSPTQKTGLMGYSMGGRVCLHLAWLLADKIDRLVLVAPDGLYRNPWYRFVTQTSIGNRLFRYITKHPSAILATMNALHRLHLLNNSIYKIGRHHFHSQEERELLYKRWTVMQHFNIPAKEISTVILQEQIPTRMLFGKYDGVILSRHASTLQHSGAPVIAYIAEAGHQLLKEKHSAMIRQLLMD